MTIICWLAEDAARKIFSAACVHYPLETGGVLMGWWMDDLNFGVTAVIDAGPGARHQRYAFAPDSGWQLQQIAEHYARSGRRETYLGDWHTHPDGTDVLSRADKATLRRIARTPDARAPRPVMLIANGEPEQWRIAGFVGSLAQRLFWRSQLQIEACLVRVWRT